MINRLLDEGANVNATDSEGFTALSLAVKRRYGIRVNELLSHGAHPLVGKRSAVYVAIKWKNPGMLKRLLRDLHTRAKHDDKKLQHLAARIKRDYPELAKGHPIERNLEMFFILKELSTTHWRHQYPVPAR